jgi:hypothetical protein
MEKGNKGKTMEEYPIAVADGDQSNRSANSSGVNRWMHGAAARACLHVRRCTQARPGVVRLASALFSKSKSHEVRTPGQGRPPQAKICCLAAAIDGFATCNFAYLRDGVRFRERAAGHRRHQRNYTTPPRRNVGRAAAGGDHWDRATPVPHHTAQPHSGSGVREIFLPFATPGWSLIIPDRLRLTKMRRP